jgi:hypothetical protein
VDAGERQVGKEALETEGVEAGEALAVEEDPDIAEQLDFERSAGGVGAGPGHWAPTLPKAVKLTEILFG